MKTICIYHTRTGTSEQIAKQIAAKTEADVMQVTDGKSHKGFFGYVAAAVIGLKKELPVILPCNPPCPLEEYDNVVIVAPIWCENVSPVMRAFLAQNKNKLRGSLYYVITSMSGISYKAKIDELRELSGKPYTDIAEIKTHKNEWTGEVSAFAEKLRR